MAIRSLKTAILLSLTIIVGLVYASKTLAVDLYISDKLYVPVRKGQGNQFAILHKGLPSGTKVKLIKRDENWTEVTTSGGVTGWVRNQYLLDKPPATILLSRAESQLLQLESEKEVISKENESLKEKLKRAEADLKKIMSKAADTTLELDNLQTISRNAVQTHRQAQELAMKLELLQIENDVLNSEKESLKESERTTFFVYGVLAVIVGVLLAIMLPRMKVRKPNKGGWVN